MPSPVYTPPLGGPDNGNSVWTPADGPNPYDNFDPDIPGAGPGDLWSGGYPAPGGAGGIMGDIGKWWDGGKGLLNLMPGSDGKSIAAGLMIPAWMAAYQSWQNAGQYKDVAKEAMKYGDPFGQANRDKYQAMLAETYTNPEKWLNDPGHQAKRKSGIDAVSRADASKGYLGSGNMEADLAAYVTNLDNQYLSDERKSLQGLTGAQFDPAQAGKFLMQGNDQEIQAKNAALQALMYPFAMNMTENHITNQNSNPTTNNGNLIDKDGNPYKVDWSKYGSSPEDIKKEIMSITKGLGGSASSIIKQLLNDPFANVSESTRAILTDMMHSGIDFGNDDIGTSLNQIFQTSGSIDYDFSGDVVNGGVDYAPPGYGFGNTGGYDNDMGLTPDTYTDLPDGFWDFTGIE